MIGGMMDERTGQDESAYQEPENSTVDDWHGQKLARAEERADRMVEEADGDVQEAEGRFEGDADEAPTTP
jgi:hypothetical protein